MILNAKKKKDFNIPPVSLQEARYDRLRGRRSCNGKNNDIGSARLNEAMCYFRDSCSCRYDIVDQ
tara:strand:+ start:3434 stop:3628 length:195 start_codon:yes stop_codon:yes gene_type:complete